MSTTQVFSISTALLASGAIATLTFFDIPELQSQPASRSLPAARWLFSRGSHIFPAAAILSTAGFIYSAFDASRLASNQLLDIGSNSTKVNGFLAAAVLTLSISPFTMFIMLPTNFAIIEENNKLAGVRSQSAASQSEQAGQNNTTRSAWDSVFGQGEGSEFTDLSGPQQMTAKKSTPEDDKRVRGLLEKFRWLNLVRAVLIGAGGIAGAFAALSQT